MPLALAQRLRDATRTLHAEVERAGLMRLLLRGPLRRADYIGLLRNLHAIYDALELALARHAGHPRLAGLPLPALVRREALAADLQQLQGPGWAGLALAPAAQQYAVHLQTLADRQPLALGAHAYVRYLGDLNGGQVLARVVGERLGLAAGEAVRFYDFGAAADVAQLTRDFRAGLERLADNEAEAQGLVQEACSAFQRHKLLFEQLAPQAA